MPKGYCQIVVYVRDFGEREAIKRIAKQLNTSVSELVRAFFRALINQQANIQVDTKTATINIGQVNINVNQNVNVQNNISITQIRQELVEVLAVISSAIMRNDYAATYSACVEAKKRLQKIVNKLGGVPAGTLLAPLG
ncbi:MAG: hypothetical protein DRN20_06875 [Thermoplasmata archaeon]|nr:MAG: hypothetical protein DRN20_06875 [Thermoplasmata archaeon]